MSEHSIEQQLRDEVVEIIAEKLRDRFSVLVSETTSGSSLLRITSGDRSIHITVTKARR